MTFEQEQKMREEKLSAMCGAQTPTGMLGAAKTYADEPMRVSLRERVAMDLNRSVRESNKLQRLQELTFLLDKNPEVARILDLIEEVRG